MTLPLSLFPGALFRWVGLLLMPLCLVAEQEWWVANGSELTQAITNARPGDEIVMRDGVWRDVAIRFVAEGTVAAPITLRAQTAGGVTITGDSTLSIGGRHLVVSGLNFRDGSPTRLSHIIEFRAGSSEAEDCRLTDCAIIDYNPADPATRYFWVGLYGRRNRVDHCFFSGQAHSGVTLVVWLDGEPNEHRIDHNHFADHASGGGENGWETIRIGTSAHVYSNSRTVVEFNLFEACDGELEIISNKSCENVYRGNTFKGCAGMLTLRHGQRCRVEGNVFLGDGVRHSGGIRVIGSDHTVVNNYITGTDGRDGAAITLYAGVPDAGVSSYPVADRALVAFNTIVDVKGAHLGYGTGYGSRDRTELPEGVQVANNLFVQRSAPGGEVLGGEAPSRVAFTGNMVSGSEVGLPATAGFVAAEVEMQWSDGGLWRPLLSSPVVDAASGEFPGVLADIDGRPRQAPFDVGADEVEAHVTTPPVMTPATTGPTWNVATRSAPTGSVRNLSTRGRIELGQPPMIAGFVVTQGAARILIRGVGPALTRYGVDDALVDPVLTLFRSHGPDAVVMGRNLRWHENDNAEVVATSSLAVGAFPLDLASEDAAMLVTLPPGVYSAHLSSETGVAGDVLVEVYLVD